MLKKEKILIVGGGTAGLIAGRRLSDKYAVEIFEKSRCGSLPILNRIPLLIGPLFKVSNRYIKTISLLAPQNRLVPYFVSQVLGGSSVMNGCVHVFGDGNIWRRVLDKFLTGEPPWIRLWCQINISPFRARKYFFSKLFF